MNAGLDKTEMLMNLKNRMLSTEIKYYQGIQNIFLKKYFKKHSDDGLKTDGSKVHRTILVNSSTNSNLKPRHLSVNLKES